MFASLLYYAYGLTRHKYINAKYKEIKVIFKVKTMKYKLWCCVCGSKSVIKKGTKERDFLALFMENIRKRTIASGIRAQQTFGYCLLLLERRTMFIVDAKSN